MKLLFSAEYVSYSNLVLWTVLYISVTKLLEDLFAHAEDLGPQIHLQTVETKAQDVSQALIPPLLPVSTHSHELKEFKQVHVLILDNLPNPEEN